MPSTLRSALWKRISVSPAQAGGEVASAPRRALEAVRAIAVRELPEGREDAEFLPRIGGLAFADPPNTLTQQQMLDLLGLADDEFARRIFSRSGVQRRQMHLSGQMLASAFQGRAPEVEEHLMASAVQAVQALQVDPAEIGTVLSSTLFSLGCPTLAHRLAEHFEMDPAIDKYHVVGAGCASAVPLIRLVRHTLVDHPDKKCLIIAAESMSGLMMAATDKDPRSKTVGSAIFGDGCAAMLLERSAGGEGPRIVASRVHQVPDSLDAVRLEFSADDSHLQLSKDLPDVAGAHLGGLAETFLREQGMTWHMIDHWMIHPGGRRIIECARSALALSEEQVRISYQVLAEHGNVGTPSIFYVLAKTIAQCNPAPGEHGLLITIGPGVTVGLMLLRW